MGKVLVEDTRQQKDKHNKKHAWWHEQGVVILRSKVLFGDYCLPPAVAVDTKASLAELAYDIDQDHERFRRELVGAKRAGTKLYVLVENDACVKDLVGLSKWIEPYGDFERRVHAKRRLVGARLAKACLTMQERYDVRFLFCSPDESAEMVWRLLKEG